MNVILNRAEFLTAAKHAANVAPSASPLDVLRGVCLECDSRNGSLALTSTNMEIAMEQKLPCAPKDDDALVINAGILAAMLERLDGETVQLLRTDKAPNVLVSSGSATYTVPVFERGSFPSVDLPFPEDTVKVSGIPSMAKRTVFATGKDSEQPMLKCVNLMFTNDGLRAVGSDGFCVVSAKGDDKSTGNISLLIPALSLSRLARMCTDQDEFRVGTTGKHIVFLKENFIYSARLMEGSYIDADKLIGAVSNSFTALTDVQDLRKALASVTAVGEGSIVKLAFLNDRLTLSCAGETGVASTELQIIPLTGSPGGEYWFQSRQLSACMGSLVGTLTLGIAQGGMLTLSTEEAYYMQSGLRAPSAAAKGKTSSKKPMKAAA